MFRFRLKSILVRFRKKGKQTFPKSKLVGQGSEIILLEVLFDSTQYGLLKEPRILFKKADYKGAYSNDIRFDEFVASPVYYLRKGNTYEKVKMKKKAIQKIIPEIRRTEDWNGTELTEQKFVELLNVLSENALLNKKEN